MKEIFKCSIKKNNEKIMIKTSLDKKSLFSTVIYEPCRTIEWQHRNLLDFNKSLQYIAPYFNYGGYIEEISGEILIKKVIINEYIKNLRNRANKAQHVISFKPRINIGKFFEKELLTLIQEARPRIIIFCVAEYLSVRFVENFFLNENVLMNIDKIIFLAQRAEERSEYVSDAIKKTENAFPGKIITIVPRYNLDLRDIELLHKKLLVIFDKKLTNPIFLVKGSLNPSARGFGLDKRKKNFELYESYNFYLLKNDLYNCPIGADYLRDFWKNEIAILDQLNIFIQSVLKSDNLDFVLENPLLDSKTIINELFLNLN